MKSNVSSRSLQMFDGDDWLRRCLAWLLLIGALMPAVALAQLTQRFSTSDNGNIVQTGNTLTTCTGTGCAGAQSGGTSSNQDFTIINVNTDPVGGGAPANSSTADLTLPPGSQVLWAGLYWSGRTATAAGDGTGPIQAAARDFWFKVPGGSYQQVTALVADTFTFNTQGFAAARPYTAFLDVTTQVQAAGSGTYSGGGLTTTVGTDGNLGYYGGWALIVAYRDTAQPYRRLTIFNAGNVPVSNGNNQSVTVNGISTPISGDFTAYMGALVWEGDAGLAGDQFQLTGGDIVNPGPLSDAQSATGNFWNSRITNLGVVNTARNPAHLNNFAIDLKLVDISNTPANAALPHLSNSADPSIGINATLSFTTTQDVYFPHALVFVTDLFRPEVIPTLLKTATKIGGSPGPDLHPGDTIEYTISFHNQGRDGAIRVVADDPIPVGLIYVPGSIVVVQDDGGPVNVGPKTDATDGDTAEFDPGASPRGTLFYRVGGGATGGVPPPMVEGGTLLPNEGVVLRYRATIDPGFGGNTITNVVNITHGSLTFPNDPSQTVSGSVDSDITIAPFPQMLLSKVANPNSIANLAGQTTQFTITAFNYNGPVTNVNLTDTLPANWAFVANSATITLPGGGTISGPAANPGISGQLLSWNLAQNMAAGESLSITFSAITTAPPGGNSINNATVSGLDSGNTPVGANASATVQISDLRITKQASPTTAEPGDTVTYTVTVTNAGTSRQNNIVVTDPLPPGVTYVGQSTLANGFIGSSGDYFDQFSAVAFNGNNGSINFAAAWQETDSGGAGTGNGNVRVVTSGNCAAGNCLRIRANNTNDNIFRQADLTVPVCSSASSIVLSYDFNNDLNNNRAVSAYIYRGGTQTTLLATYNGGNNGTGTFSHVLTPAEIGNNTRIRFNATQVGNQNSYLYVDNVRFSCIGTTAAVRDNIPAGANADLINGIPANLVVAGDSLVLDPGQSMTVSYQVTINPGLGGPQVITNTASASSVEVPTPVSGSATVNVVFPDLVVTKSGPATAFVGTSYDYTITLTNNGGAATTVAATITDVIPTGLTIGTLPAGCVLNPPASQTVQCTVPAGLAAGGGNVSFVIPVTPTAALAGTSVQNTATVGGGGDPGCPLATPCVSPPVDTNIPTLANVSLTKVLASGGPTAEAGETLTYTVTLTNSGGSAATGVEFAEAPSAGLTVTGIVVNAPVPGGSNAGTCTVAGCTGITVGAGETLSYTVSATVENPLTQTVYTNLITPTGGSCAPGACEVDTPTAGNVSLTKVLASGGPTAEAGETLTYTVTLTNSGGSAATGVEFAEAPSAGLTVTGIVVNAPVPGGSNAGTCTVAGCTGITVGAGETLSYTVSATVENPLTQTVYTNLITPTGGSCAPGACEVDTPTAGNVSLTKVLASGGPTAEAGETLTYTVTLTNSGGSAATGVEFAEAPSAGLTVTGIVVNAPVPGGSNAGTCTVAGCTGITVGAGETLSYTVSATVENPLTQTVYTNLITPTGGSCAPGACEVDTPTAGNVSLTKVLASGGPTAEAGETLTYTVTLTNSGGSAATGVEFAEAPSAGLTVTGIVVNAPVPGGSNAGTCTVAGCTGITVGAGETLSYTVSATVENPLTQTVYTNLITPTGGSCAPGACEVDTPTAGNVSLTKVLASGGPTAEAGETLTYTVTLTNSGGSAATGVEFAEAPSAGLTVTGIVVNAPVPGGSNAGTCTVAGCTGITVGAGETLSYTVSATVENPLTQTVYTNLITPTGGSCAPGACEVDTPTAGNVSLTKVLASGGPTAEAGETLTYTVTLTNSGGSAATGVEFAEAPSAGLTVTGIVVNAPVPGGSNAGTCTVAGCTGITVGAGETLSYTVSATVENPLTQTVYTNLITPTGGSCAPGACEVDTPTAGNVSLTKVLASGGPTAEAGETLTYTVTLTNSGGSAATGVEFAEAPSAGLTVTGIVVNAPVPGGSNAGTCTVAGCTGITVGAGETLSYTVSATVENPLTQTVYTNLITPTGGSCAPGACEVDTPTAGNVSLTKVLASGGPTAEAGETLTYTVTLTNSGGSAATGVEFAEAPSAGLTVTGIVVNAPVPGGSNAGTCTVAGCTGITVGAGETLSYTVSATVENPLTQTVYTNLITPTGGSCAPGACEVDTPTAGNVSLTKVLASGGPTAEAGETLTYTVTLTNSGGSAATGVEFAEAPSAGLTVTGIVVNAPVPGGSNAGTCTVAGCTGITVGAGETLSYTVSATVENPLTQTVYTNLITPTGGSCAPGACEVDTPTAGNVSLTKVLASGGPTAEAGETLTYTVTLTNSGGSAATGVEFAEAPSAGLTVTGIVVNAPVPGGSNAGTCTVAGCTGITVGAGETLSYTVSATVENPLTQTVYTNLITPTGGSCAPGACEVDTPTAGNVSLTKVLASGGPTAEAGETLTYTVTLTNSGGSAATGVEFAEAPSAGLTVTGIVVNAPVPGGSNAGTCTVAGCTGITVGAGETLSYTVSATVENPLTQTVYTNLITPTGGSCAPGACEVDTPTAGNVSLTKVLASGGPTAEAGETLTYTVTLTNSGGSAATGVEFAEAPSAGLTVTGIVVNAPVPGGSNAGTCTVAGCTGITVGAGETLSYTVSATVENPLTQTVYTNLITPTGGSCAPGACEVDTPTAGNVSLTKVLASGGPTAEAGETLTYTVTLTNSGGSAATGVEFAEAPSAGLTVTGIVVNAPVPGGSNAGTCTVAGCTGITVGAGETLSYTVSATVENPLTQTVYTNLITPTGGSCAPGACEVDTPTAGNVSLTKVLASGGPTAEAGETLTYTVTLTNSGGSAATGVEFAEAPSAGLTVTGIVVNAPVPGGSNAGTCTVAGCTGITVGAGETLSYTVSATVENPLTQTVYTNLITPTGGSCAPGACEVDTPTAGNVSLTKVLASGGPTAEAGETLTYTVTLTNSGGSAATGVEFAEAPSAGLTVTGIVVNAPVPGGSNAGTCTVAGCTGITVGAGETLSYTVSATVENPLTQTVYTNLITPTGGSCAPGACEVDTPTAGNVSLTKVLASGGPTAEAGETLTYTVTLTNSGGSAATGVEFAEAPSAGLTVTGIVVNAPVPGGSNAGTCTVAGCTGITVGAGETLSYTVSATVENPLTQTVYTNLITPTGGSCAPGACEVDTPTAGNVSLTKVLASGGPTAEAGETLTYTVTLTNSGGSAATGVEFAEAPSAGLTVTGIVVNAPVPGGSNAGTCTVAGCTGITVGAGETLSYTVSATVENPLTQTVYTNLITPTGGSCAPGACEVDTPTAGNVSLTKVLASGGPTAEAGETLTYTVTLTNSGGSAATGVEFAEAPSAGLTVTGIVVNAPVPGGSNAGTCTVAGCTGITVGAGETLSYTVSATVENPLTQTVYTNLITPTGGSCAPGACEVDTPTAGNVSLTKVLASGGPTAEAGETLTYTVTLTNSGGSAATGVEFAEAPSAGLTVTGIVVNAPVPGGSNAGTCTVAGCTGITVGAGETLSYTVSATVENPLTQTVYTNLITPTGGSCAPGACEVDTPTAGNVSLTKVLASGGPTAEAGETLTYTVTLTNSGGSAATGVEFAEAPSAGLTVTGIVVNAPVPGGSNAGTCTVAGCTGITVGAGETLSYTVSATVENPLTQTVYTNLITPTGGSCAPGACEVDTPTAGNVSLTKVLASGGPTAEAGETLTYTVTLTNSGGSAATGVEFAEAPSAGLTVTGIVVNAPVPGGSNAGTCTVAGCTGITVGAGETLSYTVSATVENPLTQTVYTNLITPTGGSCAPGACEVDTPTAGNVSLTKVLASGGPTAEAGETLTYTVTLTNSGGSAATGVEFAEAPSAGLTVTGIVVNAPVPGGSNAGTCTVAGCTGITVGAGETLSYTVSATVENPLTQTVYTNLITPTGGSCAPGACEVDTPTAGNVSLTKVLASGGPTAEAGETLTYTVTLTNSGGSAATGVEFAEAPSAGLTVTGIVVNAPVPGGSNAGTCTVAGCTGITVGAGETLSYTVSATVENPLTQTVYTNLITPTGGSCAPGACEVDTPTAGNVSLTKVLASGGPTAEAGETLTYTVTLTNSGGSAATGVEFAEAPSAGLTVTGIVVNAPVPGGSNAGTCTVAGCTGITVGAGETLSYTVSATVENPLTQTVYTNLITPTGGSCAPGACEVDTPTAGNVSLTKVLASGGPTAEAGETLTYTVTLTNSGGSAATGVEFAEAPSAGLTVTGIVVNAPVPGGSNAGTCTVAGCTGITVGAGETLSYTVSATVENPLTQTVYTNLITPTGGSCAPGACEVDTPTAGNVSLTKVLASGGPTAEAGETLTYTVTLTNSGGSAATGVEFAEAPSAGLTVTGIVVNAPVPGGSNAGTCTVAGCTGITVGAGETLSYTVSATVENPLTQTVYTNLITPTGGSCAPGACEVDTPTAGNVSLTKVLASGGPTAEAGETLTYTVTLTNSGGSAATGVEFAEAPSAGLTVTGIVVNAPVPGGSNAGTCTVAGCTGITVGAGETLSYTVSATVENPLTQTVYTNLITPTGGSCAPGACEVDTPTAGNVSLTKVLASGGPTAEAGETLTYTVTLTNSGGSAATGVEFAEAPSAGLTVTGIVVNAPVPGGSNAGTCTVAGCTGITVGAGETLSYTVSATVENPLTQTVYTNLITPTGGSCAPGACEVDTPTAGNVSLTKVLASGGPTAEAGETLTYTVTLTNSGGSAATGVEFAEAPSAGLTVTGIVVNAPVPGGSNAGTCTVAGCTGITVGAGETLSYTVSATVENPLTQTVYTNLITPTGGSCAPGACEVDTPTAGNVSLTKVLASGGPTAEAGETLTYTVTLTNSGGSAATGVEFAEAPSAGLTVTGIVVNAPVPGGSNAGTCTVAGCTGITVGAGETLSYTVSATVENPLTQTVYTNLITPTGGSCAPGACEVDTPTAGNVSLTKVLASGGPTAEAGETLTYTVTLTNSGGSAATGVEFAEAPSAGLTVTGIVVNAPVPGGSNAGTCTVAGCTGITVGAGETLSYTVSATVENPLTQTVYTNLITPTGGSCAPGACEVDTPTAGNVSLTKVLASGGPTAEAGETLTYTVTLTNSGGSAATGVEFAEAPSAGLTVTGIVVNAPVPGGSNAGTCTVAGCTGITVGAGETLSYTVSATVENPLTQTVYTNLITPTGGSCAPGACEVDTPTAGNVSLTKVLASGGPTAEAGETLTYTVTLTNSGGSAATGVEFAEAPSAGLTVTGIVVNAPVPGGSNAGTCTVAGCTGITVGAGETLSYTVSATVENPLTQTVYTNLITPTGGSCAPGACEVDTPTAANITLLKALTAESGTVAGVAEPGETLTYTITLTNNGGVNATGVGITDVLDPNVGFVSADNGGVFGAGSVTWTGLTVNAGGNLVLTVQTQVADPIAAGVTQILNLVHVTGSTPPACPPSGPQCVITPTLANLAVSKVLSGESITADGIAEPGEVLTYTITVSNAGGTVALNTIINEVVPQNTTFFADSPNIWVGCVDGSPAGTACDTIVDVPAQSGGTPGTISVDFMVLVDDPLAVGVTSIFNAVALNDETPPDCVALPGSPGCAVVPTANLRLTKVVDSVTPTGPGRYRVTYRIDVVNLGGSAGSYTLTDTFGFPGSGVVYTGNAQVTTTGGTINPALPGGQYTPSNGTMVQISDNGVGLAIGATHTYTVSVPIGVQPGNLQGGTCTGTSGNGLYNSASITGTTSLDSAACAPVVGDVPLIHLVKTVTLGVDADGDNYGDVGDVLEYEFTISNPGALPLTPVQLFDPRLQSLQCDPLTIGGQPLRVIPGDELYHDEFDIALGGALQPGDEVHCTGTYTLTAADVLRRQVVNTATATGTAVGGPSVSSVSTAIFTMFP